MFTLTAAKLRYQLTFEGSWPMAVAFLGSGRKLAVGNQRGQIFIWQLPEQPPEFKAGPKGERQAPNVWPVLQLVGHDNEISRLVATADGKQLVSASYDRTLRLWPVDSAATGTTDVILDEETRKREARGSGKKDAPTAAPQSVETLTTSTILAGHKDWIYALGMSGDGKRLISGDAASQVIVWDIATHKSIATWSGHPWNWIAAASLSVDGKAALVSEYRYKRDDFDIPSPALKIWDVTTGKESLDILKVQFPKFDAKEHNYNSGQLWRKFVGNGLIACALSPDGKLAAVGQGGETEIGKVHLLEVSTGKLVRTISGHQSGITDLLITADSKYVLSTGRDTAVRICQVSDGKEVAVLGTPRGGQFKDWFSAIALSPDERTLAATDIAGKVHIWSFGG